jgi:hypothetical protein
MGSLLTAVMRQGFCQVVEENGRAGRIRHARDA